MVYGEIPIMELSTRRTEHKTSRFHFLFYPWVRALIFSLLIISGNSVGLPAVAEGARDALWEIISSCLEPTVADYCKSCRWPRAESACPHDGNCTRTTEVWAETRDFAVIRDLKMCGCPEGFVHGLAIPRTRVTGVEDPNRPDGIWRFAWDAARNKIDAPSAIALAVNPPNLRSQDQLHVHIVRLKQDARRQLNEPPSSRLQDLDGVWRAAAQSAKERNLIDYGVIVVSHPDGGFLVRVEKDSPEWLYTEATCR